MNLFCCIPAEPLKLFENKWSFYWHKKKKLKVFAPSLLLNFNLLNFYDNAISSSFHIKTHQNQNDDWVLYTSFESINLLKFHSTLIVFIYYNTFSFTNSTPGWLRIYNKIRRNLGICQIHLLPFFNADFLYPHSKLNYL